MMVALSPDGTKVAGTLKLSSDGIVVTRPDNKKATMMGGTPVSVKHLVVPRTGFATAYARTLGIVFLVGGQGPVVDPNGSSIEGSVVAINVATGDRMPLPVVDYRPANVITATYSVRDNALWVLEEERKDGKRVSVQIARIGVLDGSVRFYRQTPRLNVYDKLWLTVDLDGRPILTGSSKSLSQYFVHGLLERGTKLTCAWVHRGKKETLQSAPIVDSSGMRLIVSSGEIVPVTDYLWRRGSASTPSTSTTNASMADSLSLDVPELGVTTSTLENPSLTEFDWPLVQGAVNEQENDHASIDSTTHTGRSMAAESRP
jgi:hypothetical protein